MEFDYSSGYSPRACRRCKLLKRKCDKVFPSCQSCARSHFKCLYQSSGVGSRPNNRSADVLSDANSDIVINAARSSQEHVTQKFPPIYFLDFDLYQRTFTEAPRVTASIQQDLQTLTEDIREHAQVYFRTIHPWMPFLSKKLFNERLLSPLTPRDGDTTILFACVVLICSLPDGENMSNDAYTTIKSSLLEAGMAGMLSIRILQAWILLCLYELGHAIYPAAYLSIGACARYSSALGLDGNESNVSLQSLDWIAAEERVRARWAVLILDRFSNLGCPSPSLSTDDPSNDTRLPIDDISWDQGVLKDDSFATLATPPTPQMGRFALTAMAASLLGRVIRHTGSTKHIYIPIEEDTMIIDRALAALTIVTQDEGLTRGFGVCTPTVFCHSARILLALGVKRYSNARGGSTQEYDIIRCGIASDMVRLSKITICKLSDEEICPFPLNAAYHAAVAYLEANAKQQSEESLEGLLQLKSLFIKCNQRWRLGGAYFQLIEAREAIHSSGLS